MYIRYLLVLAVFFLGCTQKKAELVWNQSYPAIGSQSSPRSADLNQDGVLDFVMGGGKNEYQESEFGVFAFDGKTGKTLWNYASKDQIYGSATFIDIDADGTKDVVIGGRSNILLALNGKTGKLIWEWTYKYENDPILKNTLGNFQNTVPIPDQNGDKVPDLLVQNGGS
ncbi:MAG: FG-GAP-like repeat-containing protein, partial [Leadbetterella sp.]|nr:FG-GAP-like repeat-containing protein [Leadbetterella sp.]